MATLSATRSRLLFLLPFVPRLDARHGGRTTAGLIARLAERHDAALICLRAPGEGSVDTVIRERCQLVEEVPAGSPSRGVEERSAALVARDGAADRSLRLVQPRLYRARAVGSARLATRSRPRRARADGVPPGRSRPRGGSGARGDGGRGSNGARSPASRTWPPAAREVARPSRLAAVRARGPP